MMRKHGSPEAAEALGRALLDKNLSETVRLTAIDAIGAVLVRAWRRRMPRRRQLVESHPSLAVRKQATQVLSHVLAQQLE